MVENSTDAQPVFLLLWDDSLRCFLLIVIHCTARKLQLAYVRSLSLVNLVQLIVLHRKGFHNLVKEVNRGGWS